jgi:hypothetical protein
MLFAISEAFSSIRDFMEAGGSVLMVNCHPSIFYVGNDIRKNLVFLSWA